MKLQGTSENRRWFAPAATALCLAAAISPSFAFGKNLIVNGMFETGNLESWTRNTSTGSANKQGTITVYSDNSWVESSLGKVLVMQSYNYTTGTSATSYGNSTDSYVVQSFNVDATGEYTISLGYAGRKGGTANWANATSYVRLYKGTDIAATPVFEGAFTPTSSTAFSKYRGLVQITETGTYTLQLLRPQPTGAGNEDKTVIIDNVSFDLNHIANGTFETGVLFPWTRNSSVGEAGKQGELGVKSISSGKTFVNAALGGQGGDYALYMASYNYSTAAYLNSTDTYAVQTFEVGEAGEYVLSFDYAARNHSTASYWQNATNYVCIYQGTNLDAAPVFKRGFSATSNTEFSTFSG